MLPSQALKRLCNRRYDTPRRSARPPSLLPKPHIRGSAKPRISRRLVPRAILECKPPFPPLPAVPPPRRRNPGCSGPPSLRLTPLARLSEWRPANAAEPVGVRAAPCSPNPNYFPKVPIILILTRAVSVPGASCRTSAPRTHAPLHIHCHSRIPTQRDSVPLFSAGLLPTTRNRAESSGH